MKRTGEHDLQLAVSSIGEKRYSVIRVGCCTHAFVAHIRANRETIAEVIIITGHYAKSERRGGDTARE